jgi:hypothetical protein
VVYKDPHHDITPVYLLQDEAGDAKVRFWLAGRASAEGRPLVGRHGNGPGRTGKQETHQE